MRFELNKLGLVTQTFCQSHRRQLGRQQELWLQIVGRENFCGIFRCIVTRLWEISRGNMKCFVTGASGFIGSNLVHELVAQGHQVKTLLRPDSDKRGLSGVGFEGVTGDVFDRELLKT